MWMLVIALGLVLAAMRQLDQPETVERLDQLFGVESQTEVETTTEQPQAEITDESIEQADEYEEITVAQSVKQSQETLGSLVRDGVDLSAVEDNTYFLPEERPAWFSLFEKIRQLDKKEQAEKSVGKLTYAQLLQQPEGFMYYISCTI